MYATTFPIGEKWRVEIKEINKLHGEMGVVWKAPRL